MKQPQSLRSRRPLWTRFRASGSSRYPHRPGVCAPVSCRFYLPVLWHIWALGMVGRAGRSQQILCQPQRDGYQQSQGAPGRWGPAGSRASGTLGGREDAEKGETHAAVPGWGKEELRLAETLGKGEAKG